MAREREGQEEEGPEDEEPDEEEPDEEEPDEEEPDEEEPDEEEPDEEEPDEEEPSNRPPKKKVKIIRTPQQLAHSFETGDIEALILTMGQDWDQISHSPVLHETKMPHLAGDSESTEASQFADLVLWHGSQLDRKRSPKTSPSAANSIRFCQLLQSLQGCKRHSKIRSPGLATTDAGVVSAAWHVATQVTVGVRVRLWNFLWTFTSLTSDSSIRIGNK